MVEWIKFIIKSKLKMDLETILKIWWALWWGLWILAFFKSKIIKYYQIFSNRNNIIILLSNFKINWGIDQNNKNQVEIREKIKDYLSWKEILWKKIKVINYEFDKLWDFRVNVKNVC